MNSSEDPYAVLGVSPGATQAEIVRAFRARVLATHPDTRDPMSAQGADTRLQQLLAAYSKLRTHAQPAASQQSSPGPVNITVRHHDSGAVPTRDSTPPLRAGPVRRHR
ncbi:J domain-containing protein [Mycolicibacterium tusciae]|uniref:J domain-containing protein n=1 Tax=Mycolicibacterium tusciae TaxID=75922 RepID=UPI001F433F94|nr:J domain-containing protein [Mycolicibacterium tusciae]